MAQPCICMFRNAKQPPRRRFVDLLSVLLVAAPQLFGCSRPQKQQDNLPLSTGRRSAQSPSRPRNPASFYCARIAESLRMRQRSNRQTRHCNQRGARRVTRRPSSGTGKGAQSSPRGSLSELLNSEEERLLLSTYCDQRCEKHFSTLHQISDGPF